MTLLVKLLTDTARAPTKATDGSAGFDLYADADGWLAYKARGIVPTGISLGIDPDKVGLIFPVARSALMEGIDVLADVIHPDFPDEIKILIFNHSPVPFEIKRGDRIAQLLIVPAYGQTVVVTDKLGRTSRGKNGFGSSGT